MLQWSEKFRIGHPVLDAQHQMLISYINRLESMSHNTNPSPQEAAFYVELIMFLDRYVAVHFAQEERCMEHHKCPLKHENAKAHRDFLQFVREFKKRFDAEGCRPEILKQLHDVSSTWIQEHILNIDLSLRPCLNPDAVKDE